MTTPTDPPRPDTDHTAAADERIPGTGGERTPGVWIVQHGTNVMVDGDCVATCGGRRANKEPESTRLFEENKANAAFICRAVNSHDDLLAAARVALEWIGTRQHRAHCRYRNLFVIANMRREKLPPESDCTCGLWQTREALRAAIEKATGGGEAP